jgi:hypothetical protein
MIFWEGNGVIRHIALFAGAMTVTLLLLGFIFLDGLPSVAAFQNSQVCKELGCEVLSYQSSSGSFVGDERAFTTHVVTFYRVPYAIVDFTTVPEKTGFWTRHKVIAVRLIIQEGPPMITTESFFANVGGDVWKAATGRRWEGKVSDFCETKSNSRLGAACNVEHVPHPFIPGYPTQNIVALIAWVKP